MYHCSTQYRNWTFTEQQLKERRAKSNADYIERHIQERDRSEFLTADEEAVLLRYYEMQMKDFCNKFRPPMPKMVIATSLQYFKRFYVRNSVMDYHPRDIYLICVYSACKIDEFIISIIDFIRNIKNCSNIEQTADVLLSYELLLIEKLDFQLIVHNAYRPFEGLIIDLKTHLPPEKVNDADHLRMLGMNEFLEKTLTSDVYFFFPPSQVALTALVFASVKEKVDIDAYIVDHICSSLDRADLHKVKDTIRLIASVVNSTTPFNKSEAKALDKKLEKCYNRENDPRSAQYQKKRQEQFQSLLDFETNLP